MAGAKRPEESLMRRVFTLEVRSVSSSGSRLDLKSQVTFDLLKAGQPKPEI